jgi:hypothetical protein
MCGYEDDELPDDFELRDDIELRDERDERDDFDDVDDPDEVEDFELPPEARPEDDVLDELMVERLDEGYEVTELPELFDESEACGEDDAREELLLRDVPDDFDDRELVCDGQPDHDELDELTAETLEEGDERGGGG